ncbi:MAG TPA: glycosyltransferase family A protein [Verrucomicrobiae bacterium]
MKPDVTIVIPGFGRPDFLPDLLSSIQEQTVLNRVAEVIVSEDGGTRRLEQIAGEFKNLPIRYASRKSSLGLLGHHKVLLCEEPTTSLTALLHDDDWWAPDHLETACSLLDNNPSCAAVFANIYDGYGSKSPMEINFHNWGWRAWVASGCDFQQKALHLDLIGVLMACMLDATFHFSTMVGRSAAVREAFLEVVSTKNEFDCDRTFPVFLAKLGGIDFVTKPSAFIRLHPAQETQRYVRSVDCMAWKTETTRWMVSRWPHEAREAADRFNREINSMSPVLRKKLSNLTAEPLKSLLIDNCGFHLYRETPLKNLRWALRQVAPPVVLNIYRQLRKRFRNRLPDFIICL